MNLLAHLHLSAGCDPDGLTANVLADYLTRFDPVEKLPGKLARRMMPGIHLHRRIDSFTDRHEVVARARQIISPERQRLAGVIVDIIFDYYLSRHWSLFSPEERQITISRGYATMAMVSATGLSRETQALVSKMRETDWLSAYGTMEGQALTFLRVSRRSPALARLKGAESEIRDRGSGLERCFLDFYPDLVAHVSTPNSTSP